MKLKFSLILPSLALALSVGAGISLGKNNKVQSADAIGNYSTNASTYYNGITATSGTQLAAQLHDLITSTHRYYTSYDDNGSNGYQKHTDQYYQNGSKVNGYIYEFYSGAKWPNAWAATSGNTSGGYNREHCWCQSLSGGLWGTTGGGADMHHLRPVEVRLNSTRGNNLYGTVTNRDSNKKYAQLGSQSTYALGGYCANSTFEPLDSKKGDVARIILYTYLHYNSYSVTSLFGSYGTTNGNGQSSYFKTSLLPLTNVVKASSEANAIKLMLNWNASDPVDEIEQRRNEQVAVYQGNRNPFIDNSSYADAIWGTTGITSISKTSATIVTGNTTTISAISSNSGTISWSTSNSSVCSISSNSSSSGSTITLTAGNIGSATITASITISGQTYTKTCAVTVTAAKTLSSISVEDQQTAFTVGDSFSFGGTVTATYTDSTSANVSGSATFSGYDMSTAGNYTVTVSYTEGNITKTATYSITVVASGSSDTETTTISYSDVPDGYTKTTGTSGSFYKTVSSTNDLTVYYSGINTKSSAGASDHSYGYAMFLKNYGYMYTSTCPSGYYPSSVTATFSSSTGVSGKAGISFGSSALSTRDSSVTGSVSVNGTCVLTNNDTSKLYWNFSTTGANVQVDNIEVVYTLITGGSSEVTLSSISLDTSDVQTVFNVDDTFNYDGLIVTAHYSDNSSEDLDSFTVSSPDMSSAGMKTVTVSYSDKSQTYQITVNAASVTLSSITVSNQKTSYYVGDTFVKPTVTAHFSDNSTTDVTNNATFTGYNLSNAGNQTVTVSYTSGTTETTSYSITVTAVTLSSISITGYNTSFFVGDTFSFGGTVTANYNNGSTEDVTSNASFTGYDLSSSGNQTVTVAYSGQTQTYQITVVERSGATDSTQFSLITSTSDLEVGKSYIITNGIEGSVKAISTEANSNNRKTTSATISNSKITRGSSIMSFTLGGSSGAWTFATENYAGTDGYLASAASGSYNYLRVISTAGTATISFSGDEAVINIGPHSSRTQIRYNTSDLFACYSTGQSPIYLWKEVEVSLSSISLDTTNVQDSFSVGDQFNYEGLVVTATYSNSTTKTVTPTSVSAPNMSTIGTKTVTVTYTENNVSKTATYEITVTGDPSITWTAPVINVYTGSTLSSSDVNAWGVTYNDGSGHTTTPTYNQITVKLGGTTISIPHTWVASDDGKTLTATYNSLTTHASNAVQVTQTINNVYKQTPAATNTVSWTATAANNLGSKISAVNGTDTGTISTGDYSWDYTRTLEALSNDKNDNISFQGETWIQLGSNNALESLVFETSNIPGTIKSVSVVAASAGGQHSVTVDVGGTKYIDDVTLTSYSSTATATNPDPNNCVESGTGSSSGKITISFTPANITTKKALLIRSISVTYETPASSVQIANNTSHIEAQRAAVAFANAFNAAMDETENCTTGLDAAWASCSTAYTSFKQSAASLGETEEAWCLNLIKYATAQYSDDSGEACIERMMKTYEICVQKHGQTAFMSDLVTLDSAHVSPLINIVGEKTNSVAIIVIISMVSVTAIGGYFFLKKRRATE